MIVSLLSLWIFMMLGIEWGIRGENIFYIENGHLVALVLTPSLFLTKGATGVQIVKVLFFTFQQSYTHTSV